MTGRLLIAGVGNIFLSDDGFGVQVAAALAGADLPDWAVVADYGIRGMHLAHDLAASYDRAILIDAAARGGAPGTLYVIEPEPPGPAGDDAVSPLLDAHGMQPDVVLAMLATLGGKCQVLVVGCEPATLEPGIGLSAPVQAAVSEAATLVTGLVQAAARQAGHRLAVTL